MVVDESDKRNPSESGDKVAGSVPPQFQGPPVPRQPKSASQPDRARLVRVSQDAGGIERVGRAIKTPPTTPKGSSHPTGASRDERGVSPSHVAEDGKGQRQRGASKQNLEEAVAIQTMREDIAEARRRMKEKRKREKGSAVGKGKAAPRQPKAPTLPLPAEKMSGDGDEEDEKVIRRAPPRMRSGRVKKVIVGIVACIVLGGGAVGAWWWYTKGSFFWGKEVDNIPLDIAEVATDAIPRDALLVVKYDMGQARDAADVRTVWEEHSMLASSVQTLMAGDPRLLLESNVSEFYYVLLPDDPRLYLVVPKVPLTEQLFTQQSSSQGSHDTFAQVLDKGKWLVVHSLDVQSYADALQNGTFTSLGGIPQSSLQTGVQWIISPSLFSRLSEDFGEYGDVSVSQFVALEFSFDTVSNLVMFTRGIHAGDGSLGSNDIIQAVGQFIPSDAEFARLSANFANDVEAWRLRSVELNGTTLAQPEVSEFISRLASPYAYFRRQGPDGVSDIGLVIALPESLRRTLLVGNPVVEYAVRALIPFITDQPYEDDAQYTDTVYKTVPLRYINFLGYTQTVDYTITDDYIFFSSSREGMYRLVDTVMREEGSMQDTAPWQYILQDGEVLLTGDNVILGSITHPSLVRLLPVAEDAQSVPVGIVFEPTPDGEVEDIRGVLYIGDHSE